MMQKSIRRCPVCNLNSLVTDPEVSEIICSLCGQVIADHIQESRPEWRTFNDCEVEINNNRSRIGMSTSLARHDMGLSTVIGRTDRDASGNRISAAMFTEMKRLRTWDFRSHTRARETNFKHAFTQLDRLKDELGLSDAITEKAAYIYRKAQQMGLLRGRISDGMIAAAVCIACREMGSPRTLKDISNASNIKKKDGARCYRLLITELDLKMPVVDPVKCVARIASKAGLSSERTRRKALEILKKAEEGKISAGKDPVGLAAAALYVACVMNGENKTQKDVAEAAGVTEVTIRNRYKGLKLHLKL
jgi:transcription initiation factor TFIIB